jgi:hypothetical protein
VGHDPRRSVLRGTTNRHDSSLTSSLGSSPSRLAPSASPLLPECLRLSRSSFISAEPFCRGVRLVRDGRLCAEGPRSAREPGRDVESALGRERVRHARRPARAGPRGRPAVTGRRTASGSRVRGTAIGPPAMTAGSVLSSRSRSRSAGACRGRTRWAPFGRPARGRGWCAARTAAAAPPGPDRSSPARRYVAIGNADFLRRAAGPRRRPVPTAAQHQKPSTRQSRNNDGLSGTCDFVQDNSWSRERRSALRDCRTAVVARYVLQAPRIWT